MPATQNPASNAAQTPAVKPLVTVKDVLEKSFSFDTLIGFGSKELTTVAKDFLAREKSLADDRKAIGENLKTGFKPFGKVIAAAQECFDRDSAAGVYPDGYTFATFCEEQWGKKLESMGRAAQCKRVFQKLVRSGKLPESDFDHATTDWLTESVSKILDLALEKYGPERYLDSAEITQTVDILKVRPEKAAATLRTIKGTLAGKEEKKDAGPLDAEKVQKLVTEFCALDFGLAAIFTALENVFSKTAAVLTPENAVKAMTLAMNAVADSPAVGQDEGVRDAVCSLGEFITPAETDVVRLLATAQRGITESMLAKSADVAKSAIALYESLDVDTVEAACGTAKATPEEVSAEAPEAEVPSEVPTEAVAA